ncbi:MAG: hypothetical protein AAGF28_12850 [Pseudomonadota bacterium]
MKRSLKTIALAASIIAAPLMAQASASTASDANLAVLLNSQLTTEAATVETGAQDVNFKYKKFKKHKKFKHHGHKKFKYKKYGHHHKFKKSYYYGGFKHGGFKF